MNPIPLLRRLRLERLAAFALGAGPCPAVWAAAPGAGTMPRAWLAVALMALYLAACGMAHRRWRRRRSTATGVEDGGGILIAFASQSGQGEQLARRSADQLQAGGVAAHALPLNQLDRARLADASRLLLVLSTYGEGEAPDNGAAFAGRLLGTAPDLSHLRYAVLALGDRGYRQFCGFARRVEHWLQRQGGVALFDRVEVDRGDPGALQHWQRQLGLLGAAGDADWQPPPYQYWTLRQRRCLNPGSRGGPVFHLRLQPPADAPDWRAGDIAEIGPRHPAGVVADCLRRLRLGGAVRLATAEGERSVAELLAERCLPQTEAEVKALAGLAPAELLARLPRLPHREYSIASMPTDGALELLVREARRADGNPGLGSGWLCRRAAEGEGIALRLRRHAAFHGPALSTPLILIGSGTGLAGLRGHLRERAQAGAGASRNWLLFGERERAVDDFCRDELVAWLRDGHLQRLDLAFSRDQAARVYVQHRLREAADELDNWVRDGAAIYVCGSLDGMGRAVDATLAELLGRDCLAQLAAAGRYRRDLY